MNPTVKVPTTNVQRSAMDALYVMTMFLQKGMYRDYCRATSGSSIHSLWTWFGLDEATGAASQTELGRNACSDRIPSSSIFARDGSEDFSGQWQVTADAQLPLSTGWGVILSDRVAGRTSESYTRVLICDLECVLLTRTRGSGVVIDRTCTYEKL